MDLDKFNISNCNGLIVLESININAQEFYKIIEIVKFSLRNLGITPEGLKLYYQRNFDATSILAIQVTHGDHNNMNNYMINGCKSWRHECNVNCDVYMHSEAKSAQKSMKLANLISQDIVNFFEKTEQELLKSNNFDLSFSLMIPLDIEAKKEENSIKNIVKRILKKHHE